MKEKIAKLLQSDNTNDYNIGKLLFLNLFKETVIKRQKKDYWGVFSVISVAEAEELLNCRLHTRRVNLVYLSDDLENIEI